MISFTCQCGKPYRFSSKFRSRILRCGNCGVSLVVPDVSQEAGSGLDVSTSLPSARDVSFDGVVELTDDHLFVASAPDAASPVATQEYYMVSGEAPIFLKDHAMTEPEDVGPPSEALSVILSREAVAQHMRSEGETLGLHPTPVPLPPQRKKRSSRSGGFEEPFESDDRAVSSPERRRDAAERPMLQHAATKSSHTLVLILLGVIVVLVACIIVIIVLSFGFERGGGENPSSQWRRSDFRGNALTT